MSAASDFLRTLSGRSLEPKDLDAFLVLLDADQSKDTKLASLNHLLLVVDLSPEQAARVAQTDSVKASVGLQHALKRYASSKQYDAERTKATNETAWKKSFDFIAGASVLFPF